MSEGFPTSARSDSWRNCRSRSLGHEQFRFILLKSRLYRLPAGSNTECRFFPKSPWLAIYQASLFGVKRKVQLKSVDCQQHPARHKNDVNQPFQSAWAFSEEATNQLAVELHNTELAHKSILQEISLLLNF